jgi:PAS domain S-box-containing protein
LAQNRELAGGRRSITAVIHSDAPPTYYQDPKTQKAAGFAVDVMDEIAGRAGLSVTYTFEKDWPAIVAAVTSGRADLAPVLGISEARNKLLVFTTPVETVPVSLFVRSDNTTISSLQPGLVVGVIRGSAAYDAISTKYPSGISLKSYDYFSEGLFDLLAGQIDVFCCPATTLTLLAREAGVEDRIKVVGAPVMELKRGMAMRQDNAELFAKLNAVTEDFVGSPEYKRIYTKWYGKTKPLFAVSKKMLSSALLLFIAVGAMALWRYYSLIGLNRRLQRVISERTMAEESLRDSEHRYHQLFENMQEGFMIQDIITDDAGKPIDVRYLDVNPAIERFLGHTRAKIIGQTRTQVLGTADPAVVEANSRVAVTGQPLHMERYSAGAKRWYESFSYSFGPGQVATLVLDITERKRAEEKVRQSEAKYRGLFESSKDGIFIVDLDGNFIDINSTAYTRLGYTKEEMLALPISKLDPPEFALRVPERIKRIREHGFAVFDSAHQRKDGTTMPVEINARLFEYEGRSALLSVVRDITERKKAEEELTMLNQELQAKASELERAYNDMESFSYSISHDLRAPLRIIVGLSDILLKDHYDKLDDDCKELLKKIIENTRRMDQLVLAILDLSKTGRQRMNIVDIDMRETASLVAGDLKAMAPERTINIDIRKLPPARGDFKLIRQALINVLSNAVKFTKDRAVAVIEVGGRSEDNENVYFVKDNGAGFAMDHADRLFKVFQRLHTSNEFEGIGIGLSIVDRIIKRHGGRLWAEGKPAEGATFYFTLPKKEG